MDDVASREVHRPVQTLQRLYGGHMTGLIIVSSTFVKNPGRLYRPLYCPLCGSIRIAAVDFIVAEHSEQGYFVWYAQQCLGLDPIDKARKCQRRKGDKECGRKTHEHICLASWKIIVEGIYY